MEWDRGRHTHGDWRITVDTDHPTGGLQAPIGLHVHGHEAVLSKPDPIDAATAAGDDDPLRRRSSGLDLAGHNRHGLLGCRDTTLTHPFVDFESRHVCQHAERWLILAEQMVLARSE